MEAGMTTQRKTIQSIQRDKRSWRETVYRSSQPSIQQMEMSMFEALRKLGGFRVDYMNQDRIGSPKALGFYVLGNLPEKQAYSRSAKRSLLAGMLILQQLGEIANLVAIYLDVNEADNALRPAYARMKQDLQSGMFRRLFVMEACDLAGNSVTAQDWWMFTRQLKAISVISWGSGQLYDLPDLMLASDGMGVC
jgi:hypothetical protein